MEEKSETTTKEVDRIFQVLFNACYPEGRFINLRHYLKHKFESELRKRHCGLSLCQVKLLVLSIILSYNEFLHYDNEFI